MEAPPLLTDFYQLTMAYALWKSNKVGDRCTFEFFFRKNPFQGEFTVFAGLADSIRFIEKFKFSESDVSYLRKCLPPYIEEKFFEYLLSIDCNDVEVYAVQEGTIVFPRLPLMIVSGPLIVVQLLETPLLNCINYPSLIATNAARHRLVAGKNIKLMEFGLRRAQGPNGALTASKYAYIGGFDATSNVYAGKVFNIPVCGTQAHSFLMSFSRDADRNLDLCYRDQPSRVCSFTDLVYKYRQEVREKVSNKGSESNTSELNGMISYAVAYPFSFFALVDTYDVRRSGLVNFAAVSLALNELGYEPKGIRIDSGDLAYLSRKARDFFREVDAAFHVTCFSEMTIMASNDITEEIIMSLAEQRHEINVFGIGTNLVTCQKQPALGCVCKIVELNGEPKIKLSNDSTKLSIPCKKKAYRLFGATGEPLIDLIQRFEEDAPVPGQKILCQHPFKEAKRAYVVPTRVLPLHKLVLMNGSAVVQGASPALADIRHFVQANLDILRSDIKRYLNPTPYKVSVSSTLYKYMHSLWLQNTPIDELN